MDVSFVQMTSKVPDLPIICSIAETIYQGHHLSMQQTLFYHNDPHIIASHLGLPRVAYEVHDLNEFIDKFRQTYQDDNKALNLFCYLGSSNMVKLLINEQGVNLNLAPRLIISLVHSTDPNRAKVR